MTESAKGYSMGFEQNKRERVKEFVLSLFELEPDYEAPDPDSWFYGYFETEVSGIAVKRPCYLFFNDNLLYIMAPFAAIDEVADLADEARWGWGLGSMGSAFTYHNVIHNDMVLANPEALVYLLGMFISQAGAREHAITGRIAFRAPVETESGENCQQCNAPFASESSNFCVGCGAKRF
jgi:hypothetical protein